MLSATLDPVRSDRMGSSRTDRSRRQLNEDREVPPEDRRTLERGWVDFFGGHGIRAMDRRD